MCETSTTHLLITASPQMIKGLSPLSALHEGWHCLCMRCVRLPYLSERLARLRRIATLLPSVKDGYGFQCLNHSRRVGSGLDDL